MQTSDYLQTVMRELKRLVPQPVTSGYGPSQELFSPILSLFLTRCSSEDVPPFFITLLSDTLGWVPTESQIREAGLPEQLAKSLGCSVLEMEILNGAFWPNNPNGTN